MSNISANFHGNCANDCEDLRGEGLGVESTPTPASDHRTAKKAWGPSHNNVLFGMHPVRDAFRTSAFLKDALL